MFTGIIENKAKVVSVQKRGGGLEMSIAAPRGWKLQQGQSISVNGICSTVERFSAKHFSVFYMPETLRVTTAGAWRAGRGVNLERSLKASERIEGHIVQGHIDGVGTVKGVRGKGASREITIALPRSLIRFVASKGSLAVDGVSLTVATLKANMCTLALIPHTLSHTNLGSLKKGARVNIEVDVLARYLAALRGK